MTSWIPNTPEEQSREDAIERIDAPPAPSSPQMDPNAPSDLRARILIYDHDTTLAFKGGFRAPDVEIMLERDTVDHEVVSGFVRGDDNEAGDHPEFMAQPLGHYPPEITMTGWLSSDQLRTADNMVTANVVGLITARFVGLAVPESIDIPYSRTYHERYGWLFETEMNFFAVRWDGIPLTGNITDPGIEQLEDGQPLS